MLDRLAALACTLIVAACAGAPQAPPDAVRDLAPTGRLRAAINFGNAVLAQKDALSGEARGASVDLARELARRLGVPLDMIAYDAAGKVADAAKTHAWDIAFLAIDPARAMEIAFTAPYVIIEGGYIVASDSPLRAIEDFDREGVRIAVGARSAYDLYLTRTLKKPTLVRMPTTPAALNHFLENRLEAAAGIKAPLVKYAAGNPKVRVIPGRFMVIEQAIGTPTGGTPTGSTPTGRGAGARYLREFVEDVKASGFVADALARSGQHDAAVAPRAN